MTTNTFFPSINSNYIKPAPGISLFKRFIAWCSGKEEERLLWQGIILGIHACVLTPVALLMAVLAGTGNYLYIPVIIAITINVISNLAALPTKITIPVFFFSILIDLGVIAAAVIFGMDFSGSF